MRIALRWALVIGLLTPTSSLPATVAFAAAPAATAAGSWSGPFLGYTFTFEFTQGPSGWTGRYRSTNGNKWVDVQNLEVSGETVRFTVVSQPPSLYALTLDPAGRTMKGTVQIGKFPVMPLNLTRAS